MALAELNIQSFRNIQKAHIYPSAHFNLLYGANGAGKTSFLEAIYQLGTGRSFRASQFQLLIQKELDEFFLFAQIQNQNAQQTIPIGLQRFRDGRKNIRVNGENVLSMLNLAQQLPLLFLGPESHRFFHDGPKGRRQFLDWGVFHVEHDFHSHWRLCEGVLKHRNALLKNRAPYHEIKPWDVELVKSAEQLDRLRSLYVSEVQPIVEQVLNNLLNIPNLSLRYLRGWDCAEDLAQTLRKNYAKDLVLGYTQIGPHRADLQLFHEQTPVQNYLSQGQQKLAAYALYVAQGILLEQKAGKKPVYLIDDLSSELDYEKRAAVLEILAALKTQIFITGTSYQDLKIPTGVTPQLFHVEQGMVRCG